MERIRTSRRAAVFGLMVCGTVLGIAGTDLVLPAVPFLPVALGGTPALAQMVLAAFVAGAAVGLLIFGALAESIDSRLLLVFSLGSYGIVSLLAATASDLHTLAALRFIGGAAGSAPAVFAPGIIRLLFDERGAVRAMALLGSIESLAPALAPIAGAALLTRFGWPSSFVLIGAVSIALAAVTLVFYRGLPRLTGRSQGGGYIRLLADRTFVGKAMSQAFSLGGILIFVFGAPTIIVDTLGGSLADFIILQVVGVAFFILSTNLAERVALHVGTERAIRWGTWICALAQGSMAVYALLGGRNPMALIPSWILVNVGFGIRGPSGFLLAVVAARGDDARGAALVVLAILLTGSAGTALVAPFITSGLPVLTVAAALVSLGAVAWMRLPTEVDT